MGNEPEDFSPALILVKTEGLGYLPPFSLQDTEDLGVLSFPILLKTRGHCHGVDGCSLSNIDDFELDVALLPLPFSTYSAMMYYMSGC